MNQAISSIRPNWVVPGARVLVTGAHLPMPPDGPPHVLIGTEDAFVVAASHDRLRIIVPSGASGTQPLRIDELPGETAYLEIAHVVVSGVHMVDSPAYGPDGRLYVTQSGDRSTKPSVPLYRVNRDGSKEPVTAELGNPTSLALGPDGTLYVSSRFEGLVYRVGPGDHAEVFASELGVPTGLAFGPDGRLYVGDRSGSILAVTPDRQVETIATLPPSVAAFHLAFGPDENLYVTAPTLASHDAVYRITSDRIIDVVHDGFGRPQGLAFDAAGILYVAESLAGAAGLYRMDVSNGHPSPELVVAAPTLVGVTFDPFGGLLLASNDTVWRLDNDLKPFVRTA